MRHYLNYNEIKWAVFAREVLGVGQARLSVLLGHPKPWSELRTRVKTYYQRMLEWMDTRATYGNNPYTRRAHPPKPPKLAVKRTKVRFSVDLLPKKNCQMISLYS